MELMYYFKTWSEAFDYLAPDGSEIRQLPEFEEGGLCHCTLPAGKISTAVKHKTVNEIWYCISGSGEIWQSNNEGDDTRSFSKGDSFSIPKGNCFQFRNVGNDSLQIIIATIPKWPGMDEAISVKGKW